MEIEPRTDGEYSIVKLPHYYHLTVSQNNTVRAYNFAFG